jgi:radical SAM superfamily enzyme YgiQ (UPF0313 family)
MNILVVNPPNKPFTNTSILAEPLDVLQIATIIKEKHNNVRVLDMDVNRMDNNINDYLLDKNIVVFVYDYQLPLHTSHTINNIFEIIKNTTKETKFIIIGKTSTHFYEDFLNNGIDVVIKGIADNIINQVIDNVYDNNLKDICNIVYKDNNNIVVTNEIKVKNEYNKLPMIDRSLIDLSKYMDTRTIITSRGCIGKCNFCTTPTFFGIWNGKDSKEVVDEIEYLINYSKTKKIIFLDDNMTVNKNRMYDICNEIEKRNIKCLFGCLSSINCYDKDLFKKMYSVGFRWVHFGIESGSTRLLKLMNKDMDLDYIKKVINEVKKIGFRVRNSFILDYPTSTKEDIALTRKLIRELKPHELRMHYLAYRVGTVVFEENKDINNKTQYIHSNHPNIPNDELTNEINLLIDDLKKDGYIIIYDNVDWNKFNNLDKNTKFATMVPTKYGMCWYE